MELTEDLPFALQELRSDEIVSENVVERVSALLIDAVEKRVDQPVAIAFSGGVDSTLLAFLCTRLEKSFTLYTVGLEGSKDIEAAEIVANAYGWPLRKKILSVEELEDLFKKVISLTGKHDPVTVGVGAVTYAVMSMAEEDVVLTGLGSEEIFAGYERHKGDINAACWDGMLHIWERDITRDLAIAQHFGKEIRLPFMDKELIAYGMRIDPSLKIRNGERKYVLREAAVNLGLKKEFAFRKKYAAQYGSKIDAVMEKLAKKKGMTKSAYLESLSGSES